MNALPSRLQLQSANAMARRLASDAVYFRRAEVVHFLAAGLGFIQAGRFANIPGAYLDDFARGLSDAVSDAVGGMRRDLDNAGLDPDAANVDDSELEEIIHAAAAQARLRDQRGGSAA